MAVTRRAGNKDRFWEELFRQIDPALLEDDEDDEEDPDEEEPDDDPDDDIDDDYEGTDLAKLFGDDEEIDPNDPFAKYGGSSGGLIANEDYGIQPDNRYYGLKGKPNISRGQIEQARLDAERRAIANRRPPTPRSGPAPLSRIPSSSLTPGNPYAGVDDSLARSWEREHGALKSTSSKTGAGGIAGLAAKLGYTPNGADLPEDFRSNFSGRFTNTPVAKSASDAFNTAKGFGGVSDLESKYYLPFFNDQLGGKRRAVSNTLRGLGLDPDRGNPYVDFLGSHGGRLADQALVSRALKGESPDERTIASDISGAFAAGKSNIVTPETLRAELSALKGRDDLSPSQAALIAHLESDPDFATGLVEDYISPDLRKGHQLAERRRMERFVNRAPEQTGMGMLDFILKGL